MCAHHFISDIAVIASKNDENSKVQANQLAELNDAGREGHHTQGNQKELNQHSEPLRKRVASVVVAEAADARIALACGVHGHCEQRKAERPAENKEEHSHAR